MVVKSLIRPLLVAGFFYGVNAKAATVLDCHLAVPAVVVAGQAVPMTFELVNRSQQTLWLLDWNTPLEGLRAPFVHIAGPTGDVAYLGPQFKRGDPDAAQYRQIAPGARLQATVDLAQAYALAVPGRYRVTYDMALLDVVTPPSTPPRARSAWRSRLLQCNTPTFQVRPR
jgi:hypothetical protein